MDAVDEGQQLAESVPDAGQWWKTQYRRPSDDSNDRRDDRDSGGELVKRKIGDEKNCQPSRAADVDSGNCRGEKSGKERERSQLW